MFSSDSPKLVGKFGEFFREYYEDEISRLAQNYPKDKRSLWVDHTDIYSYDPDFAVDVVERPREMIECAERALMDFDLPVDTDLSRANVRIHNSPRSCHPSDLDRADIDKYVAVSGQLTRITDKNPRLDIGFWECQRCGTSTQIPQGRHQVQEPHECAGCERSGPFRIITTQSEFVDQRKIKLEEPIEERSQARGESVPVYVDDDLVDFGPGSTRLPDHAGETATIEGVARITESDFTSKNNKKPETSIWIEAKAITFDTDVEEDIRVEEHKDEFLEYAARDDAVDLVAESLAPSLHAEEGDDLYVVRRACAAWLYNGYRMDPDGAESFRGDMHMALIGDPGTGKSTLMSSIHKTLPKSEYRTGTGLTKVGLTAAAVREEFAGESEWTLQPGVLPRSDGGHCLIDEVDAIVDENTKAIHDALEGEQKVKADKAGIKADLPTRCSLLVGGNPTKTRFDRHEPLTEQIDLDPALFDRMDLVFSLQDEVAETRDREKAKHSVESWDELSHVEREEIEIEDAETAQGPVPTDVLRAWIKYARDTVFPKPTKAAKEKLVEYYVDVRNLNDGYDSDNPEAVPATMRTLEAGMRLSTAFARLRLSEEIDKEDAMRAIELSKYVVGLRFDRESGKFDDRMTSSGNTTSQKTQVDQIRETIMRLEDDADGPGAHIEEIKEAVDAAPDKVEHRIDKLHQKRAIYEPRTGYFRLNGGR